MQTSATDTSVFLLRVDLGCSFTALFAVASAGNMLHAMAKQPELSLESSVFAGCVLALVDSCNPIVLAWLPHSNLDSRADQDAVLQMIGLCYASTILTGFISILVGVDHGKSPEPEFLDAGAGI